MKALINSLKYVVIENIQIYIEFFVLLNMKF